MFDPPKAPSTLEAPADPGLARRVMAKVSLRLLPFLFVLYVVNILDRVNVGMAKLTMLADLGMNERIYGRAAGIFYLGYILFEVPSNLMLRRTGARVWIARIMVSWGLVSAAMMFVGGPWSFYGLRFLLGVAEAGFFPGIILYLSYWFPARDRARAVSRFMIGSAVTGVLGNPLSGAILDNLDGAGGLAGWQWVFLLEGLPAVALGVLILYYLTDRPEQAAWLAPEERDWLAERMSREEKHRQSRHGLTRLRALSSPRVCLLCLLYFTVAVGANAFGFFGPTIIQEHFAAASKFQVGLLQAVPSAAAVVAMIVVGAHSDRTGERRWHVAGPAFVACAGWALAALTDEPWVLLAGLTLAQAGMLSMLPPFWSLPTAFLSGAAAAGGIALINSLGNVGGWLAPDVIGQIRDATGSFTLPLWLLALTLLAGGVLALRVRHDASLDLDRS